MDKIVIIINGNGGVGKDTLCEYAGEKYKVSNIIAMKSNPAIAPAGFNFTTILLILLTFFIIFIYNLLNNFFFRF